MFGRTEFQNFAKVRIQWWGERGVLESPLLESGRVAEHCVRDQRQEEGLVSRRSVFGVAHSCHCVIQHFYSNSHNNRATACVAYTERSSLPLSCIWYYSQVVISVEPANLSHAADFLLLLGRLWQNTGVVISPENCGNWIVSQQFSSVKCRACGRSQKWLVFLQPKIRLWCHLMQKSPHEAKGKKAAFGFCDLSLVMSFINPL